MTPLTTWVLLLLGLDGGLLPPRSLDEDREVIENLELLENLDASQDLDLLLELTRERAP